MDNKQKALQAIRKHPLVSQQLLIQLTEIPTDEWIQITRELEAERLIVGIPGRLGIDLFKATEYERRTRNKRNKNNDSN